MKIGLKLREISRYKKELLALLFLFIVIGSFCLPIFKNINCYLENDDWLEHMSYHRFLRDSLINYHQFPLWCPFFGGGYPIFSYPSFPAFNPLAVNSLLFGELFGLKINIFLIYTICLIGMFCLTRYALRFTYPAVLFSTLSVTLDGWFPRRLKDGNYTEFWYFYIPLIFYIILKAETNKRYIIIAAMLLSFVLMSGSISYMTFCLFFCIFFIGELIFRTKKNVINMRRLVTFLLIIILSLCYGMIKLLPMVELLRVNSRIVGPQIFQGFYLEKTVNMIKCLFFECGYIKFILCMVAIIFIRRKIIVWIFLLAVCTLIALSIDSPISLSAFLSYLPVFKSIKNWYKYFDFYIIFTSAIISGELLTYISLNCKNNVKSIFLLFIFLVGIVPLYWNNIKLQYQIFTKPIPLVKKEADFYQVESIGLPRDTLRTFRSNHYLNLLRNVGTIDFYTELPMRQSAIPKYFIESAGAIILYSNPGNSYYSGQEYNINGYFSEFQDKKYTNPEYKGEVYCLNPENKARLKILKANSILLEVDIKTPGKIVLNQNYHKYWHADKGRIADYKGLIGIYCPHVGKYLISLAYLPISFYVGLLISIISLCVSFLMFSGV